VAFEARVGNGHFEVKEKKHKFSAIAKQSRKTLCFYFFQREKTFTVQ
jgi:hypothetical protein